MSPVAQWVKDLAWSLLWLGSLLWCRFKPWLGNFHMLWAQPKKKKKKKNSVCGGRAGTCEFTFLFPVYFLA